MNVISTFQNRVFSDNCAELKLISFSPVYSFCYANETSTFSMDKSLLL
jgi:hypothetical protein